MGFHHQRTMWLWRNPDNVTHRQLLSFDQIWRRSTALIWSRWGCRRLADNIWLLTQDNNNNLLAGQVVQRLVRRRSRSSAACIAVITTIDNWQQLHAFCVVVKQGCYVARSLYGKSTAGVTAVICQDDDNDWWPPCAITARCQCRLLPSILLLLRTVLVSDVSVLCIGVLRLAGM